MEFSSEVARLRAHVAIYGSHALKSRVKQAQTTFCCVHTWQVKVDLLATFVTPKDSRHEILPPSLRRECPLATSLPPAAPPPELVESERQRRSPEA